MSIPSVLKTVIVYSLITMFAVLYAPSVHALTLYFKNSQIAGNGSDTVAKLKTDLPNMLSSLLRAKGHRFVEFENYDHDITLQITTNVSISYKIIDARVVFEKSILVLEKDGQELEHIEFTKPASAGSFRTYGSNGQEYAQEAASFFAQKISTIIPNLTTRHKETPLQEVAETPMQIILTEPVVKRGLKLVSKDSTLAVAGRVISEFGVAAVTVNEQAANIDNNGNFYAALLLKPGENKVLVKALSTNNRSATERFTITRDDLPEDKQQSSVTTRYDALAVPPTGGNNYALVIGINQYQNIARLRTATNDAQDVAQILSKKYGFEVRILLDNKATRSAILRELNDLKNKTNPNDRLLIYYAGHGYNDAETETSYWLPVDADNNDPTNWVEARSITDQLKRAKAKQVLIVADSCYSGTMTRAIAPSLEGKGSRDYYIRKLMDKTSRVLIASGGNEPVSDSGGTRHSIFADVFIKALQNPPFKVFSAEELLIGQIKESVAGQAEQTPEYKIIRNSGHDGGDFVFEMIY